MSAGPETGIERHLDSLSHAWAHHLVSPMVHWCFQARSGLCHYSWVFGLGEMFLMCLCLFTTGLVSRLVHCFPWAPTSCLPSPLAVGCCADRIGFPQLFAKQVCLLGVPWGNGKVSGDTSASFRRLALGTVWVSPASAAAWPLP